MDEDGYPEEEELQDIRDAAGFQPEDACALLERVRQLWHWPNYATVTEAGDKLRHEFCTGGWSGNESLIEALQDNTMFWLRWWQLSERGGRYVFETPNVEFSGVPVGHSINHPAGGTSAGTQGYASGGEE